MSTWTLEHCQKIVAAWPEVEECDDGRWHNVGYGLDNPYICTKELGRPERFRLPPKKRIVEWTASDVKPGMVFRKRNQERNKHLWLVPHSVSEEGILFIAFWTWGELLASWEYSFDAVTWFPCHKEVNE